MVSSSDPQSKSSSASETFDSNGFFSVTPKHGAKVNTVYRELILYLELTFAYKYFTCKLPPTCFGHPISQGIIFITIKLLMQDFEIGNLQWLHENATLLLKNIIYLMCVDVSYTAPQANEIINVALHREYSSGIVFIFSLSNINIRNNSN
jgi:hypothetical protein